MTNTPLARRPRHRSVRVAARRLLLAALGSATGTTLAGTLSVTTPGAGSWTVPDGVTQIGIVAVGGGGGGSVEFWSNSGQRGGHGARIALDAIAVTPGQVISYFVGGGGGPSNIDAEQGSGGGGSTNVRFDAASNPALIAGGGGGGATDHAGGDACPSTLNGGFGGAGAQSGFAIAGPGGGGGIGGSYPAYNLLGGNGFGGPGGNGFQAGNGGLGEGSGKGGDGAYWASGGSGEGYPGGGGGYGGGADGDGPYGAGGAGAGGSLWPGMTPTTPNAPVCVPAGNGGEVGQAGGHGALTITWNDDQQITCGSASKTFGDPPFAVPAASVSAPGGAATGALSYADAAGACRFTAGGELELIAPGTCTYVVRAAGGNGLNPAEQGCSIAVAPQGAHRIDAVAAPAAGGSVSCAPSSVAPGGGSTCTATPGAGYSFAGWGGHCTGTTPTCTLAGITASRSVTAFFAAPGTLSLPLPEGPQRGQPVRLAADGGGWVLDTADTATTASLGTPPAGVVLPHGVVSLRLTGGTPGDSARVVLTYPAPLPPGTRYYKYGPTADEPAPHWYPFAGAQIAGNTVTLTLTDGGAGDSDGLADGTITDPGGPALFAAGAAPIPTLSQWATLLLIGLTGLAALAGLRRRPD